MKVLKKLNAGVKILFEIIFVVVSFFALSFGFDLLRAGGFNFIFAIFWLILFGLIYLSGLITNLISLVTSCFSKKWYLIFLQILILLGNGFVVIWCFI